MRCASTLSKCFHCRFLLPKPDFPSLAQGDGSFCNKVAVCVNGKKGLWRGGRLAASRSAGKLCHVSDNVAIISLVCADDDEHMALAAEREVYWP